MGSKLLWMWVWVIFVFVSLDGRWSQGCLEQERLALLGLKPFFNSPSYLRNWVEGEHYSIVVNGIWLSASKPHVESSHSDFME
ncbi:hypothetical protein ACOSQ2_003595 [Xanthoceras sorbifolium]